jgi:hypothetical protein
VDDPAAGAAAKEFLSGLALSTRPGVVGLGRGPILVDTMVAGIDQ